VAAVLRDRLAEDLRRLCGDAGVAQPALSRVSGVSQGYISEILAGSARPSIETYARLAAAVGADLSMRLYPNTGPAIHDRHQARILEGLLARIHPRWRPTTEVAVRQPARGWVDLVLAEPRERIVVATEIESGLRRLEQMIRWSREKADSLPSWPAWAELGREATISQLLIVRRTRANRDVARSFAGQLAIAYPAHPDDAIAALTGTARWPGAALVWVQLERDGIRLVPGR
jgi:transcriptional regulator with XRE-family HTH domain